MSRPVRVVHVTSVHKAGDTRIFHKECVSLAEAGYEVYLVAPDCLTSVEKNVYFVGVSRGHISRWRRITKYVNMVYEKAVELNGDIYHLHDPELLRVAHRFLKRKKNVIYDAHEDLPRQILAKGYLPQFSRRLISSLVEKYENKKVKPLSCIVAATPLIRDRFLKINSNTIDVNNYPSLRELYSGFSNGRQPGKFVCYVGGLTRIRGIVELIKAMEKVDAELILAGEFLEKGLRDELVRLPGWKKVHETGFLSRDKVKEVYAKSAVGIVTLHPVANYVDSLPVKMFEYMASGLPVVASNFPLWLRLISESNAGLCVDPLNPAAVAAAINDLLNDPEKARSFGANGSKMVFERYNWEFESKKLLEMYARLSRSIG